MHPSNAQQAKFPSRETPPPVLEDPDLSRQSSRTGHESRISTPEGEKKKERSAIENHLARGRRRGWTIRRLTSPLGTSPLLLAVSPQI